MVGTQNADVFTTSATGRCHVGLAGNDVVNNSSPNGLHAALGGPGSDTLNAGFGPAILTGGDGNDTLNARNAADELYGQGGNDRLNAAGGNDILQGGSGNDVLNAGAGDDDLAGNAGNDTLNGSTGVDSLVAGPGQDVVNAGSGNDTAFIYDICEITAGEVMNGDGGSDLLVAPVGLAEIQALGVVVNSFEGVLVEKHSCLSDCVEQPDCSGHGVCAEGPGAGEVLCECDSGWAGPNCEIACLEAPDCSVEVYPTAIGGVGGMLAHATALFPVADALDSDSVLSELRGFLAGHPTTFQLAEPTDADAFELTPSSEPPIAAGGLTIHRFVQTYRGIPISGPDALITVTATPRGAMALTGAIVDPSAILPGAEDPISLQAAEDSLQAHADALLGGGLDVERVERKAFPRAAIVGYEGIAFAGIFGGTRLVVEAEPSGGPVAPLLVVDHGTADTIDNPVPIEARVESPSSDPVGGAPETEIRDQLRTGAAFEGALDGTYRLASPPAFVRDMTGYVPPMPPTSTAWNQYLATAPAFTSGATSFAATPGTIPFKAQDTYYKVISLLRLAGERFGERWDSLLGTTSGFGPGTFAPRIIVTIGEFPPSCPGSAAACATALSIAGAASDSDFAQEPAGGGPQESLGLFVVSSNATNAFNVITAHELGHNLDLFLAAGFPTKAIMPYCDSGSGCTATCVIGTEQEAPTLQESTAQLFAMWGIHALFDGIDANSCEVLLGVSLGADGAPHNDTCRPGGEPFDLFSLAGVGAGNNNDGFPTGGCETAPGYRLDPLFQAFWEIMNRQQCTAAAPYQCSPFDLPTLNPAPDQEALARNAAAESLFYALRVSSFSHEMLVDMMGAHYGCSVSPALYADVWCEVFEHHGVFQCDPLPSCQVCGNQALEPGEGCDDGNGDDTDDCTNACELAVCGDGFVWAGVEECDDNNLDDGDGCSSTCTAEEDDDDGEADGGAECMFGDPGCPGGPCLLDLADEPRFQSFPGVAAYFEGGPDLFGPFCNDPLFVCREGPANEFTCYDCTAAEDGGWGCPCGEGISGVSEDCAEYPGMECVGEAAIESDPALYPLTPRAGACFPDGEAAEGFCTENCGAQARVCAKLVDESLPQVCVAAECFPPCETDGPESRPVCDREGVCGDPEMSCCIAACISDADCGSGFCTDWGECWDG